jgi:hypothetical protein
MDNYPARYSAYSLVSKSVDGDGIPPRTWSRPGHSLGRILPSARRYEVYRMRRVVAFSRRTKSWLRLLCSQIPAHRKAAKLYTGRCPSQVQPGPSGPGQKVKKKDVIGKRALLPYRKAGQDRQYFQMSVRTVGCLCEVFDQRMMDNELERICVLPMLIFEAVAP